MQQRHASKRHVLEAVEVIGAKAREHAETLRVDGVAERVQAQVGGIEPSRGSAVSGGSRTSSKGVDQARKQGGEDDDVFLTTAKPLLPLIRSLEFGVVISGGGKDDPLGPTAAEWTDESKNETRIERFKKALQHEDPSKQDPLASGA